MILVSVCGCIITLWAAASVLNQLPLALNKKIAVLDVFHMIPQWNFFAPNPGTFDCHLLFKDYYENSESGWQEVPLLFKRNPYSFVWNPNKRLNKALFDITQSLKETENNTANPNFIYISVPYLLLLNVVSGQPGLQKGLCCREFMIIRCYGNNSDRKDEVVFLSRKHKI